MSTRIVGGDKVRLVCDRDDGQLGAMRDLEGTKWAASVPHGTEGIYLGIHPTLDDWHMVQVVDGEQLYVPVHSSQFTAAVSS